MGIHFLRMGIAVSASICLASIAMADSAYVSPKDAELSITCICVLETALCENKLADAVTGAQRVTWVQSVFVKADVPTNLDAACFRKRDVPKKGGALCCTINNDEAASIERLFRGVVN